MSKFRVLGCLVMVGLGIGCGGSAACPEGYARVGDLCMQLAGTDAGTPGDGGTVADAGWGSDGDLPDGGITPGDGGSVVADGGVVIGADAGHEPIADAGPTCVPHDEVCNERDDDCDERVDEGIKLATFYGDADGDGHGDATQEGMGCSIPAGAVGLADDCDDADPTRYPHAAETCDGIDANCDGIVDTDLMVTFYEDRDADGYGADGVAPRASCAPTGTYTATRAGDCNDDCPSCHVDAHEVCDGLDQDCTLGIDNGVLLAFYRDGDGDGYGDAAVTATACTAPMGFVSDPRDCADSNAMVHPGATEICNALDDNCIGGVNEGLVFATYYRDSDGDGFAASSGDSMDWCALPDGYTTVRPVSSDPRTIDCFPNEANAFPGQTRYFTAPILGAPTTRAWDYNCDASNSTQYLGGGTCSGVVPCTGTTGAFVSASSGTRPTCGEPGTFQVSCALDATFTCRGSTATRVQACR